MEQVSECPPLLVYSRIDDNRRKTRLLLIAFGVVLLPALSGIAIPFTRPLMVSMYGPATALADQVRAIQPAADGTDHRRDMPMRPSRLYASANLISIAIVALVAVAITVFLLDHYGSQAVLRFAHAQPVDPDSDRELVQIVEKLCIGAGLPVPRIHVIESAAPNAFATGRHPGDASVVVTRGLLGLLTRRELEGVAAHELSHIGNHDIRFSTTLAAMVGTVSLPLKVISAPFRFAFRTRDSVGVIVLAVIFLVFFGPLLLGVVTVPVWILRDLIAGEGYLATHSSLRWWHVYTMATPWFAVFVAPVVALLIRQALSRQREFLADADAALLTRDPEALALALVKIDAVRRQSLRVGEGTVHLCLVDPRPKGSWLHVVFPSHPPIDKRVDLLARMGNGIAPEAMQAARDAGVSLQSTESRAEEFHALAPPPLEMQSTAAADQPVPSSCEPPEPAPIPLYEQPDGWSRVLARLPADTVVRPIAAEGHFVRVITAEDQTGYVSRSAPLPAVRKFQE